MNYHIVIFSIIIIILSYLFYIYNQREILGFHYLINIENIDPTNRYLNNNNQLKILCNKIIKLGNLNVVNFSDYKFSPQGYTLVYLLSESHLSLHTWPEKNLIMMDLYCCNKKLKFQPIQNLLYKTFPKSTITINKISR